jgi:hypothetical protein
MTPAAEPETAFGLGRTLEPVSTFVTAEVEQIAVGVGLNISSTFVAAEDTPSALG